MKHIRKEQTTSGASGAVETAASKPIKRKNAHAIIKPEMDETGSLMEIEDEAPIEDDGYNTSGWNSDGPGYGELNTDNLPSTPVDRLDNITKGDLFALMNDVRRYFPKASKVINRKFVDRFGHVQPGEFDMMEVQSFFRSCIKFLAKKGISVDPNLRVVRNPQLNEIDEPDDLDRVFAKDDGPNLEDFPNYIDDTITREMGAQNTVGDLLRVIDQAADYKEGIHHEDLYAIGKKHGIYDNENITNEEIGEYGREVVDFLLEKGHSISPNMHFVPNPNLNEDVVDQIPELDLEEDCGECEGELEEATDSGSSGSYETPGCWATGTGKDSIKNSRSQKSAQFKKALWGGPGAQYINNPDSVIAVNEQVVNYFKNPSVQQVVKNVSKKYGICESKVTSLLMKQIFIKK